MIVRPFNEEDASTLYRWYHDKRHENFFRDATYGLSVEQCRQAPHWLRMAILIGLSPDDPTCRLGMVTFADVNKRIRVYRVGLLVDPEFQHCGVGKDLTAAGLEWAFNTMCAHRVVCEALSQDTRTVQGVRRAGFTHEGTARESVFLRGEFCNEEGFSMLRSEYVARAR